MSNKAKIIIGLAALVSTLCLLKYVSTQYKTTTKIDEKKTEVVDVDKDKHKQTVTTTTTKPDGTQQTTTTTVEDTKTVKHVDKKDDSVITEAKSPISDKINISLLVGTPLKFPLMSPMIYGVSISRPIIGPITAGIWGLSDSSVGISIGLQF